jgi:peptide/nickel transport system substrate-binding protein
VLVSAFTIGALALAGCTSSAPEGDSGTADAPAAGAPVEGGTITVGIDSDIASNFDIHVTAADISAQVLRNVFDSLVVQDTDGSFQPWLADSWTISDDGLTYTFTLKQGVTFTDGEPFNADAVKANFDHVVNPDTKSQYGSSLIGGPAYKDTTVIDEYTVAIELNEPFAPLLQGLSTAYLGFFSPAVLASSADQLLAGGPGVTVGTGPWILDNYVTGQQITFVKNPDYQWGPSTADNTGPAYADSLVYRILPENSVRAGDLTSGGLDVAGNVSPSDVATLEASDGITVDSVPAPGLPWSIFLNHSRGLLQDQAIRHAFQRGIDITSAVDAVYQGLYQRAWSVLGPTTPGGYDASLEGSWEYSPDEANAALDAAGWTERDAEGYRTKDGERLSVAWLGTATREDRASLKAAFQADLKEIGFELIIEDSEVGDYLDNLLAGTYDIVDWSFVRSDGDILRLHLFSALAPIQNASYVNDPEVDRLVTDAAQATDAAERASLYEQVQQWVIDDAAIVPVYVPGNITATASTVAGVKANILGWPEFYDAWSTDGQ